MPLVSVLDYASNSVPHHFLQAQMQPQWQAQEPSNEDVKVRNPMALERQKGLQERFFVVVFFFPARAWFHSIIAVHKNRNGRDGFNAVSHRL